jgi:hypothetical protein
MDTLLLTYQIMVNFALEKMDKIYGIDSEIINY